MNATRRWIILLLVTLLLLALLTEAKSKKKKKGTKEGEKEGTKGERKGTKGTKKGSEEQELPPETFERNIAIETTVNPSTCKHVCKDDDIIHVNFIVYFLNGTELDSNSRDGELFTMKVGSPENIPGLNKGLVGMCLGEHRRIQIPPSLGYGAKGVPPLIPPDEDLIFNIELLKITRGSRTYVYKPPKDKVDTETKVNADPEKKVDPETKANADPETTVNLDREIIV